MNEIRVLNKTAIEIHHIKRAIRSGGEVHRMKPRISRSQKLLLPFATPRHESHSVRLQHAGMHEVQQRFSCKSIATILLPQGAAAINREARQRIEVLHRLVVERE